MSEYVTDPLAHALDQLWHHPNFAERYQKLQEPSLPVGVATDTGVAKMRPELPPLQSVVVVLIILAVTCLMMRFSPQIGGAIAWIGGLS